ncbi:GtrA-like protein [uncultured Clostridium sp.]|uniref:GtrA family protein n=1 Tax=Muricoprocola aceti TaxID=2981772 RepID=A0ABT2SPR9_9FIRM|nr:GtrA family protein [Muricoprocola aceti]MCU6726497.1 GtrA family protein [Muricoprocola aceti]SCH92437.1 GtrA-like protein [uncultured Clostridium sp.]
MKLKKMYSKYKDVLAYLVFGVFTTLINIITYWLMAYKLHQIVMVSTIVAWVVAVFFAYITNRKWVFHSECDDIKGIVKEISAFFSCRLATGIVDWLCMFVFVDIIKINDIAIKTLANIVVIVLNYIASKLIIFKHK